MKKISFIMIVSLLIISLTSCVSTGFDKELLTKENVETLDTKSFSLTAITLQSDINITDKKQAVCILSHLPVEQIKLDLEETYGITLDTSFFQIKNLESEVGVLVSDKGQSLDMWAWQHKTEEKIPSGIMNVGIRYYNINDPMLLSVSTSLFDSVGTSLAHIYYENNWASGHTVADKKTAAIVKFAKHIAPDYIIAKDGVETYASYLQNNEAPDGGIYVDTSYPVSIVTSVSDPGVFLVIDPMSWFNAPINETYESGKTYTLKYEVDRSTFSKYNWKVVFSKEEE